MKCQTLFSEKIKEQKITIFFSSAEFTHREIKVNIVIFGYNPGQITFTCLFTIYWFLLTCMYIFLISPGIICSTYWDHLSEVIPLRTHNIQNVCFLDK